MRIAAVRHAVPSWRITNDDVLARIRTRNASRWGRDLGVLEQRVKASLEAAGTEVRYALGEKEKAIDFAIRAGREALTAAGMAPADIDFLLYAGVGRGWIEPATSCAVQAELRLVNATSFDVVDACASWLRSLQIAHAYIRNGTYRRGLIVNAECGHYRAYADWTVEHLGELDYRLGAYTIGEAATATIVTDEIPDDDFYFTFRTFGEHVDLCMIPLPNIGDFLPGDVTERHAPGRFFARSRELFQAAMKELQATFEQNRQLNACRYDICFGHEATARMSEAVTRALGVEAIYFPTHREFGNTVSASVPLGISLALEQQKLRRGNRVLIIVGSAGMSVGFSSFTF
jgi:3-oxoacyl-[acyl-carrier-protein] synthase III